MILKAASRSRSKRRIVNIDPLQNEGTEKPKYEEQQERYINPNPQQLAQRDLSLERHNHGETKKEAKINSSICGTPPGKL